ncbi:MAG: signal recognition particle-docking protein FtsY [Candidatus Paracaedibacteraceae bacterium]|nr:signal recognition particle-docking protein FtsY [Candidatus Paracaedibacteraceae bacterium]
MTTTWWQRLKAGLKSSTNQVGSKIRNVFVNRKLDASLLDEIEDILIQADMGVSTSSMLRKHLASLKLSPETSSEEVLMLLADKIEERLTPVAHEMTFLKGALNVVLMVGVNGSGKTTTISKLAKQWKNLGYSVELAACDTFRAAAIEQLVIWAERLFIPIYTSKQGHDSSGLAFEAVQKASKSGADILLIDTAGRLHNKQHLMDELAKIQRVIKKVIPKAPHHVILVLDATTGQNAVQQVDIFQKSAQITGLIITKLDGTAKGGVVVGLADKFNLPIYGIGVGESFDDLQPFSAKQFAHALVGLEDI